MMKRTVQIHNVKYSAGFTLIEMLVVIFLVGVVMALIIFPFLSGLQFLSKGRARAEAQTTARHVMDTVARDLSKAMEMYLSPQDPSVCAVVLPTNNTFPLQPQDTVIRYWQVWRGFENVKNANGGIPADSPSDKSWYEKFDPNPRQNQATVNDTDSRYIARTVETRDATEPVDFALNADDDTDTVMNALDRDIPAASGNPVIDNQTFVALSPNSSTFDVPLLRFTLVREATYRSPALLKIALTVSKRDARSGQPQDVHLERMVELKNVVH